MVAKRRHGARARRPGRRHCSRRPGRHPQTRPRRPGGTRRPARARRRAAFDVTAFDVTAFLSEVAGTGVAPAWWLPPGSPTSIRYRVDRPARVATGLMPLPKTRSGQTVGAHMHVESVLGRTELPKRTADDREELFVGQQVGVTFRAELDHRDARGRVRGRTRAAAHRRQPGRGAGELVELRGDVVHGFSRCPVRIWKIEVLMPDDCRRAAAITQPPLCRCPGHPRRGWTVLGKAAGRVG
jgi:hypothetical protein